MDRRRADVLVAVCTGRLTTTDATGRVPTDDGAAEASAAGAVHAAPVAALRPLIRITVPHTTLLGLDDHPAELAGYGPIPAHLAREIAADPDSVWQRLLTDPASGQLLDVGRTRYRPPPGMAAFVRARDGECRHPTCRRAAEACELDHVHEWQHGGSTCEANLCALCARHHDLKEHHGWHVVLHGDRTLEWLTPTGHRYTSAPVDHRTVPPRPRTATAPADPGGPTGRRRGTAELLVAPVGAADRTAPF